MCTAAQSRRHDERPEWKVPHRITSRAQRAANAAPPVGGAKASEIEAGTRCSSGRPGSGCSFNLQAGKRAYWHNGFVMRCWVAPLLLLAGCKVVPGQCAVKCGAGGHCAFGLTCGDDGYCHGEGQPETCGDGGVAIAIAFVSRDS